MTLAEPTDDVLSGARRGRCDSAERRDGRSPPPVPAGLAAGMALTQVNATEPVALTDERDTQPEELRARGDSAQNECPDSDII